jgi:hypothetical protein
MITILGTEAGIDSIRDNYPVVADPATRDRIELVTYRNALRRGDWHAGAIVFGDLERLFISEIPEVSRLWRRFSDADMPVRLLNHPIRTLRRFALLRRLHAAGINDFNVWRADEMRDGMRFPVFLHGERDHNGPIGSLLKDQAALDRALDELAGKGEALSQILVVEFCDTRSRDGLYRKFGTFRVGDRFVHRHLFMSIDWCVKNRDGRIGPEHSKPAIVDEEEAFMLADRFEPDLPALFELANVEYGRMDYGFKDGAIRVWEINTNPMLGRPDISHPGVEIYDRYVGRSFEQLRDALLALDPADDDRPFWIVPVLERPSRTRAAAALRASPARPAARWRRLLGR